MQTRSIPSIQQQPRTASDTAIHYGYVAYKDISLMGSTGIEIKCQPDDSPYRTFLPCREIVPFTNITHFVIDDDVAAGKNYARNGKPPVKAQQKTAKDCAEDIENLYQEWNFALLRPLTGFSEEDAFAVFQAIQPFHYSLGDIEYQLGEAEARIASTEAYEVHYGDISLELQPLSPELRAIARQVLPIITASALRAVSLANEKVEKTTVAMTAAFAGQGGKLNADPHDRYVFAELGETIPKLVKGEGKPVTPMYSESQESIDLKRQEIELRQKELELREREIAFRETEANKAKMAQVRAARKDADNG